MKRISVFAIAFVLLASGLNMSTATATVYENQIEVVLKKVTPDSKVLTKAQLKVIKKKASSKDVYTAVFCWAYVGVDVSAKQKKNLHTLAKSVCKEVNKLTSNLGGGVMPTFEDEELGATEVSLGFTISGLRNITYNGAKSAGSLPAASAPVKTKGKVTLAEPGNIENYGLEFLGWSKNWDGSGTVYQPGDKISLKRPLTLYAKWDGYSIDVNVGSLNGEQPSHIGFNYDSPVSSAFTYAYQDAQTSTTYEIGGFDGTAQIYFAVPGMYDPSSLTGTGGVVISYLGGGTCGWALADGTNCTIWYVTVSGDGALNYDAVPNG